MKNLTSRRWIAACAVCALAMAVLAGAGNARAATLAVTSLNDSGPGSLRQAIADASPSDTIIFSVKGTITLTSGALTVDKDLDIQGPGPKKLKISGNHVSRVFFIASGEVTLAGMTISDGLADANAPVLPCAGGGISNFGNLILSNVVVSGNQALGDRNSSPLDYPGLAAGGGVANFGVLAVVDCTFVGNLVRGGDGSVSLNPAFLAGLGYGGAISHVGAVSLTVTGSTFRQNQAIGGSGCFSPILSGHGSGGAIGSQAAMSVSDSRFDHNVALAGDNNATVLPYGFGPNKATAGAINVSGGTAAIDGCAFEHNQAIGGAGGIGSGGAIVVTDVVGVGVGATIDNCTVAHNRALGGPAAGSGLAGDGLGGGLACIAGATLTVRNSTVAHNHARGGEAEFGGSAGNGLGGGFYEDAGRTAPLVPGSSTLALEGTLVTFNLALGGEASDAGSDGQGIGGGVYALDLFTYDSATVIRKNHASTIGDNVWP
jgi:hypothetical protein